MGLFSRLASFLSNEPTIWDRGQSGTDQYATPHDLYIDLLAKLVAKGEGRDLWAHFENTLNNDHFVEVGFESLDEMQLNLGLAKFDVEAVVSEAGLAARHKIESVGNGLHNFGGVPIPDIAKMIEAIFVHGYKLPRDYVVDGWIVG